MKIFLQQFLASILVSTVLLVAAVFTDGKGWHIVLMAGMIFSWIVNAILVLKSARPETNDEIPSQEANYMDRFMRQAEDFAYIFNFNHKSSAKLPESLLYKLKPIKNIHPATKNTIR